MKRVHLKMLTFFGLLVKTYVVLSTAPETDSLVNAPGHLKPFGFSENHLTIEQTDGFLFPKEFGQKHLLASKPLLMKNAAKLSRAYLLWTDEYFLNDVDEPEDSTVLIEARKKEDRKAEPSEMSFKQYVRIYNNTDQYLVNSLPPFLKQDVVLPGPLQCDDMANTLSDTLMWFSSGGTKSVVHTDSVDNINCLFRGEKTLIMVDPDKYAHKVDMDHPEGAYSGVDVDEVDFTKYPGLAEVQYHKVDMSAGDCLYIPYKWIHQVRSTGSNIAVNVWWDHHEAIKVDLDKCEDVFDRHFTLDKVEIQGMDSMDVTGAVKDHLLSYTLNGDFDFERLPKLLGVDINYYDGIDPERQYMVPLKKMFALLDQNDDNMVSKAEVMGATEENFKAIAGFVVEFNKIIHGYDPDMEQMSGEDEDATRDEL